MPKISSRAIEQHEISKQVEVLGTFVGIRPFLEVLCGGILVGNNSDAVDVIQVETSDCFVIILVFGKTAKFNWNLITVYGDAQIAGTTTFLAKLSRLYHDNSLPCLVGEDFNIIRKGCEKNIHSKN